MIDTVRQDYCRERAIGRSRWHGEPSVEDLLKDPVMQLVMRRDRVGEDDLTQLIQGVRQNLRQF